jgi:hypothetical protein
MDDDAKQQTLLSALVTEHFVLQSARGVATSEAGTRVSRLCCIWSTGGIPKPCQPRVQIAKASSSNATATRRVTGSSTASS